MRYISFSLYFKLTRPKKVSMEKKIIILKKFVLKKSCPDMRNKICDRKCRAGHEKFCATFYQCNIFFPKCFAPLRYILFVYTFESCFYCNRSYIHFSFYCRTHCVKRVRIQSFSGPLFFRIRTEYGKIQSISLYSVRMRENVDQKNSEYGHFSRSELFYKQCQNV